MIHSIFTLFAMLAAFTHIFLLSTGKAVTFLPLFRCNQYMVREQADGGLPDIQKWGQLMSLKLAHGSAVLVDTNAFQRKMLRTLLRGSGFARIQEMDCFDTAMDEANRSVPDFLFVDYDTARRSDLMRGKHNLRSKYLKPGTNLIFLMHNATRPRVDSAISRGANWIVSRPFSPKSLDRRIRAVLDPGSCIRIDQIEKLVSRQSTEAKGEEPPMSELVQQMDQLLKQSHHYREGKAKPDHKAKAAMMARLHMIETIKSDIEAKPQQPREQEGVILL